MGTFWEVVQRKQTYVEDHEKIVTFCFCFVFCFVLIELSLRNSGALCIILGSINMFLSVSTKVNKTKNKKPKMKYVLYEK